MAEESDDSVIVVFESIADKTKAEQSVAQDVKMEDELSLDSSLFTTEESDKGISLDSSLFTTEEKAQRTGECGDESDAESCSPDESVEEEEVVEDESGDEEMDSGGETDDEPVDDHDLKEDHAFWTSVFVGTTPFPPDLAEGMSAKEQKDYARVMMRSYEGSDADPDYDPDDSESSSGEED